jgi:hypothetical protein
VVPHLVPVVQLHELPMQVSSPWQTVPQFPQLLLSDRGSTQTPLQRICGTGHLHTPLTQERPGAHTLPHVPQLAGSVWVLTQVVPQAVPVAQPQAPLTQVRLP